MNNRILPPFAAPEDGVLSVRLCRRSRCSEFQPRYKPSVQEVEGGEEFGGEEGVQG